MHLRGYKALAANAALADMGQALEDMEAAVSGQGIRPRSSSVGPIFTAAASATRTNSSMPAPSGSPLVDEECVTADTALNQARTFHEIEMTPQRVPRASIEMSTFRDIEAQLNREIITGAQCAILG